MGSTPTNFHCFLCKTAFVLEYIVCLKFYFSNKTSNLNKSCLWIILGYKTHTKLHSKHFSSNFYSGRFQYIKHMHNDFFYLIWLLSYIICILSQTTKKNCSPKINKQQRSIQLKRNNINLPDISISLVNFITQRQNRFLLI